METRGGFHEFFEHELTGIRVTELCEGVKAVHERVLDGKYHSILGIPTYMVRQRRIGVFANNNYELIKFVKEEDAQVRIELEGYTWFGRFQPIATTYEAGIIKHARDYYLLDILAGVNLSLDTTQS